MSDTSVAASSTPVDSSVPTDSAPVEVESQAAPAAEESKQPEVKQEQPKETPQPSKKYKIKVDGAEEEMDEDSVLKLAQMGRAANKRFQEAAGMRKQAEEFISLLKSNPRSVLENPAIGLDLKKFAEDYLIEQLQKEQLTPEQKRIAELEAELKRHDEEKKQKDEEQKRQDFQKLQERFAQEYEQKISDALSSGGLPRTPYTVKRMAEYMSLALNNNLDLEPKDVAKLVRQDYQNEVTAIIGQADGETLLQILGSQVADKIRKYDLAKLKAGTAMPPKPVAPPSDEPARGQKIDKPMSVHEWRELMEKRAKGDA